MDSHDSGPPRQLRAAYAPAQRLTLSDQIILFRNHTTLLLSCMHRALERGNTDGLLFALQRMHEGAIVVRADHLAHLCQALTARIQADARHMTMADASLPAIAEEYDRVLNALDQVHQLKPRR